MMKIYTSKEIGVFLLQFFAMDSESQLNYAKGIPLEIGEVDFPFGLMHSPLIELASGAYEIHLRMIETETNPSAVEVVEELETLLDLIVSANQANTFFGTAEALRNAPAWRLVRKLSRECLREFKIEQTAPAIDYVEFMAFIID